MEIEPSVRFDDTETAFLYKSVKELKKANFIFSLVNHPFISNIATSAARIGLALKLPVKGLIRSTVFDHFCGGETIDDCQTTVEMLSRFGVGTILDYSVEGEKSEVGFNQTAAEIIRTIDKAKSNRDIPFCVFKVTGMANAALLEKVHRGDKLTSEESKSFDAIHQRVDNICKKAWTEDVRVLIDAEQTWLQDPIDSLAEEMMKKYNIQQAIVFNTYQMYRSDMEDNLRRSLEEATKGKYMLGAKLVRGAYMEKEGERASSNGYPNPIHSDKESTDKAFNRALSFCVEHNDRVTLMCGSHNEYSNKFLTVLMDKHNLKPGDTRVWFAQLLGMSDHISSNLSKSGYNVAKYVPYGPVESVMPYLIRRAQENTSVAGQSSRELTLIRKELMRRKAAQA